MEIKDIQQAQGWKKGVILTNYLIVRGSCFEDYIGFIQTSEEEAIFSPLNLKNFTNYLEKLRNLEVGYYWAKVDSTSPWEVVFFDTDKNVLRAGQFDEDLLAEDLFFVGDKLKEPEESDETE